MKVKHKREREKKTVQMMLDMFCRGNNHQQRCVECEALSKYAAQRIDNCVFGRNKPVCSKCSVHCYNTEMREQIKEVMRYSGPKMIFKHPMLTFYHIFAK